MASALKIIRKEVEEDAENVRGWKHIGCLQLPQRIRFFLWLAVQDRLMTNGKRCQLCSELKENTLHILCNCPTASLVWRKLGVNTQDFRWNLPLADWILANIATTLGNLGEEWAQLFGVMCWWLWRWRNERTFRSTPNIPIDQVSFISARVHQIKEALNHDSLINGLARGKKVEDFIR